MTTSLTSVLLVCAIFTARCRLGLCLLNCAVSITGCGLSFSRLISRATQEGDDVICAGVQKALTCLDNLESDCGSLVELILSKARETAQQAFTKYRCANSGPALRAAMTHLVFACVTMVMTYHII